MRENLRRLDPAATLTFILDDLEGLRYPAQKPVA